MKILAMIGNQAGILAGVAVLFLAVLGAADVVLITFFNAPITGTVEISRVLLVSILFLGMADAVREGDNISVDVLLNALGPGARRWVERFNRLVTVIFFAVLTYLSWKLALKSWNQGDIMAGAINFRLWPIKTLAAFGATLALLAQVSRLFMGEPGAKG